MSDFDFGSEDNNSNEFFLDLSDAEDSSNNFKPLPPGKYQALVQEVKQKKSSAGNDMLAVTLAICDTSRKVYDNILLNHEKAEVVKIGRSRAKSLFLACFGKPTGNLLELQGNVVEVRLAVDKRDDSKNTVQSYSALKKETSPVGGSDAPF